jgi:hypothetical protein
LLHIVVGGKIKMLKKKKIETRLVINSTLNNSLFQRSTGFLELVLSFKLHLSNDYTISTLTFQLMMAKGEAPISI